jgi:hypothetical protein
LWLAAVVVISSAFGFLCGSLHLAEALFDDVAQVR